MVDQSRSCKTGGKTLPKLSVILVINTPVKYEKWSFDQGLNLAQPPEVGKSVIAVFGSLAAEGKITASLTLSGFYMAFKKAVAATLYYLYQYRRELLQALLWPLLAFIVIDYLSPEEPDSPLWGGILLITFIIQVLVAITVHRIVLLGPGSVLRWGTLGWGRRELRYALHAVGLLLIIIPVAALAVIPVIGGLLAVAVVTWVVARLGLVFPAIAIDQEFSFKDSWRITANHQLLVLLVMFVNTVVLALLPALLPRVFLVSSVISLTMVVLQIGLLSMVYQLIVNESNEKPSV